MSPLEEYSKRWNLSVDDIREKAEQFTVNELESIRQGIDDTISNALGIRDPFLKSMLDLFIQTNLIQPIAEALKNAHGMSGGLLGGLFGGIGKAFFGGGGGGGGGFDGLGAGGQGLDTILNTLPAFANGTTGAPGGWSL